MRIDIKPLSVNLCWQGRRFKTKDYKRYENTLLLILPKMKIPKGELMIKLEFGISSKAADIDNPIKPILDILQKKYGFDDKKVYQLEVKKVDIKKGKEYLDFIINPLTK